MGDKGTIEPRQGLAGLGDRFFGPGMTRLELISHLSWAGAFMVFILVYSVTARLHWTPVQIFIVALFAFDVAGGITVNASDTARRWFHRPGRRKASSLVFVAFHLHTVVIAAVFKPALISQGAAQYLFLVASAAGILYTPVVLRRPAAMLAVTLAFLLNTYFMPMPKGLEWLFPMLAIKLLAGHILPDRSPEAA